MQALARVLVEQGWHISGSDSASDVPCWLADSGIEVHRGHAASYLPASAETLVYSQSIPVDNPERVAAERRGLPQLSYAEMLSRVTKKHTTLAVAGTHGKSTTTAMTTEILLAAGLDPTFVVGASWRDGTPVAHAGHGPLAVVEACEFRRGFLHLRPQCAALLNVEPDHFDCFPDEADLERAFGDFAALLPAEGLLVYNAADAGALQIVRHAKCRRESFAVDAPADWQVTNLLSQAGCYEFDLLHSSKVLGRIALQVPGQHMVANALAAAALAASGGAESAAIVAGLERFAGLQRRVEPIVDTTELAIVDDYAHHPTEVAATLAAIRQRYPKRRLWCVFQPHQASRLARLLAEFARALADADLVAIADVYRAREGVWRPGEATAADLAAQISAFGVPVLQEHRPDAILEQVHAALRPGDVVAVLGAGDIGKFAHALGDRLRSFDSAR
ncbi:MAG: UDP-N-acetylmuramate--L-alanine ligase [Planctomycetes bacterium]|nr:UDP-N-acetylmuramate--L-alanine ligase [Planctomycetota bacterium]